MLNTKNMNRVSKIQDLPAKAKFWVLTNESMNYDSGYGEGRCDSVLNYVSIVWFESDDDLKQWIADEATSTKKTNYRVFVCEPVTIEMTITVKTLIA